MSDMWESCDYDEELARALEENDEEVNRAREENDDELLQAILESRRFYKEHEEPRLSQLALSHNPEAAGPSGHDGPGSSKQSVPFDPRPSTSRAFPISFGEHSNNNLKENEKMQSKTGDNKEEFYSGPEAEGFCISEGKQWIYPMNDKYPVRQYQKSIVEKALFNNTLVSLPTGLGKTFIAAVVMFNFYKWYPKGKVIFMAPTKPLVAQQIDNCINIIGIPCSHTAEMTGAMPQKERAAIWQEKRVFFLTPQIVQNDLSAGICPALAVKCVVIDEAHRAVGDYAYTMVIKALNSADSQFRVLALSATPGSDLQAVQKVLSNLMINHIELRNEQSPDLVQYTHQKNVETMVVQVGPTILRIQDKYLQIVQSYASRLQQRKVLFGNIKTMSRFACLKQWEEIRRDPPRNMDPATSSQLHADFAVVCTLIHGLELLQTYGLRLLLNHLKGVLNGKGADTVTNRLSVNEEIKALMEEIESILSPPDRNEEALNKQVIYGHPKLDRLQQVVVTHFEQYQQAGNSTRAIIFCEYREGVLEISDMLKNYEPLVKPVSFMGQASGKTSKGISQKQQLEIMEKFRKGTFNTLVSTSVGEEGLDIGEVDLIICFDAKNSPIRQVQRMGRTGRKRQGRIIMLITQGKEERKYRESLWKKQNVNFALLSVENLSGYLFDSCPRMIPPGVEPQCVLKTIEVAPSKPSAVQQDLRKMLLKRSASSSRGKAIATKNTSKIGLLGEEELLSLRETWDIEHCCAFNRLPAREELWTKLGDEWDDPDGSYDLSHFLEFLRFEQRTHVVGNSSNSRTLCFLLNWAEDRRDQMEGSQCAVFSHQVSSTQLWPRPGKKRNRVTAGITDDKEDRPPKIRKRGSTKRANRDRIADIQEQTSPEPNTNDNLERSKPKRPQFIEDEDEPSPAISCSPTSVRYHVPSSSSSKVVHREVETEEPVVSDCDEDEVEQCTSQFLCGSQMIKRNLLSSLLDTLNRQLPLDAVDCNYCDNLFSCRSVSNFVYRKPAKDMTWTRVKLSMQAATELLPSLTRDSFRKFSSQNCEVSCQIENSMSFIPRNDEFYEDDFGGGVLCGGLGDYSPPPLSSKFVKAKHDEKKCLDVVSSSKLIEMEKEALTMYTGSQRNMTQAKESLVPCHKDSFKNETGCKTSDDSRLNSQSIRFMYGPAECKSEGSPKHQVPMDKELPDSSLQHVMDDSFDFLGLSKLDDIFEAQKVPNTTIVTVEDNGANMAGSVKERASSCKKYSSPSGGNTSDTSQVSPILGSQTKRNVRLKIRKKIPLEFDDKDCTTNRKFDENLRDVGFDSKTKESHSKSAVPSSSQLSAFCDFDLCDDSLLKSSPESELTAVKVDKVDESLKQAIHNKAKEIMSRPPRSLTQQFREMCDKSLEGFTQVWDLLDMKTSKASPECQIARADSSTSMENENLIKAYDMAVEGDRAGSPDLFADDNSDSGENPADSSVSVTAKLLQEFSCNNVAENHAHNAKVNCEESSVKAVKVDQKSECCVGKEDQKELLLSHEMRSPSPVFTQNTIVKKPSKLSLRNRKVNQVPISKDELCSNSFNEMKRERNDFKPIVHACELNNCKISSEVEGAFPNRKKEREDVINIEAGPENNMSQSLLDVAVFGDEFSSSWSCTFKEDKSETSKPDLQLIFESKPSSYAKHTHSLDNEQFRPVEDSTNRNFLSNNYKLMKSPPKSKSVTVEEDDFKVAFERLDAEKKKQNSRKLSLSRGVLSSSKSNVEKPEMNRQPFKFTEVVKDGKNLRSSDDESPLKVSVRKRITCLNITSSPEPCGSTKNDKSCVKGSAPSISKRKLSILPTSSSSSNEDLMNNGWLSVRSKSNSKKLKGKIKKKSNIAESVENSCLDLTAFCDESLLSPFKEDGDFQLQDKENNRLKRPKMKQKVRKVGSKKKCAFVESEAEESDEGFRNSSDGELESSDSLDSSFINDSPPDATQGFVDMHAKYLQSIKSPARAAGGFKIPKSVHPVNMSIYSQQPDFSELNQSYANDSFCVDDEPTQYEDSNMSLLEMAEARLKAERKEKRKRKRKDCLTDDRNGEAVCDSDEERPGQQGRRANRRRRLIVLEDSSSDESGSECQQDPAVNNHQQRSKPQQCVESLLKSTTSSAVDAKESEFAELLEADNDIFLMDENFHSVCDNPSNEAAIISNPSPIKPPTFVKKTRVEFGRSTLKNPANSNHLSEPKKSVFFKPLQITTSTSGSKCSSHSVLGSNRPRTSIENSNICQVKEVPSSSKCASVVIIVSSRQVASFPELIRVLRVNHNITICPRSISNADFIISWRLGVTRTFISDLKDRRKIEGLTKGLKNYFCKPVLIIEKDRIKSLCDPARSNKRKVDENPSLRAVWTPTHCSTIALLRQAGIHLLFAQNIEETAELLSGLLNKENRQGYGIPAPLNLSEEVENRLHFFSSLPCINFALALKLLKKFPSISEFLHRCSSVLEISSTVGLDVAAARKIHNVLCEVHVNP